MHKGKTRTGKQEQREVCPHISSSTCSVSVLQCSALVLGSPYSWPGWHPFLAPNAGNEGQPGVGTCEWWHPWGRDMLQSHTKRHQCAGGHPPASLVPLLFWSPHQSQDWHLCPQIKQLCPQRLCLMGMCRVFFELLEQTRGLLPAGPPLLEQATPAAHQPLTALEQRQSSWG